MLDDYNNPHKRKEYNAPECHRIEEDFSVSDFKVLQRVKYLHEKEIVIETLPTSNMRIGCLRSFDTYQVLNWYDWWKEGIPMPPVVLETDDPGIFSTNIYNEFALIYCYLVHRKGKERNIVMQFLEVLYKNSEAYKFLP